MEKIRLEAESYQTNNSGGGTSQKDRIVEFEGKQIGHEHIPQGTGRRMEKTLYKTKAEKYIVFVEHISQWQGEGGHDEIHIYDSLAKLQEDFLSLANSSEITEKVELVE